MKSDGEIERYESSPHRIIIHRDWNPESYRYDADIALLKFNRGSYRFKNFVRPICLWKLESAPAEKVGLVAGWGMTEDKTQFFGNFPRRITAPIHDHRSCLSGKPKIAELSSVRTFCAGWKNGTGVCRGDSGGGIIVLVKGVFYLRGIVSSSLLTPAGDCDTYENAVYTDVLDFKDWINIKSNSWP